MKRLFLVLLTFSTNEIVYTQAFPNFKPLRYTEDYSFLEKDSTKDWYSKLKYSRLSNSYRLFISAGGEIRYQYFRYKDEQWGDIPEDKDGYILTRYLAHADLHIGNHIRTFVQLQSSLANSRISPDPVEENLLDIHQAFMDVDFILQNVNKFTIRIGRQEILYGSQRLVAVREGPNNRQAFDAARLLYAGKRIKSDFFYSYYVKSISGIFDDGFNASTKFWGSYNVINRVPLIRNLDIYYLGILKDSTAFDDGEGKELRHSIGSRIWQNYNSFRYDVEGLFQFGKFAGKNINAWTISLNTGYKFNSIKLKPELGLKAELISGDKYFDDNKLQTFNPLFPKGNYFGLAALIGPANLIDLHPSLSSKIFKNLVVNMDYDVFWRASQNDGMYAPNVSKIYSGKNISAQYIGQQYSTDIVYTPNHFLYFRAEFTWFDTGSFLKMAGEGKDILFAGFTTQLKF